MSNLAVEVKVFTGQQYHKAIEIVGSNLNQTKTISSSSDVLVTGSNCTIILNLMESRVVANVSVEGRSNILIINGGQCRIKINGTGNTVDATNSEILNEDSAGSSNCLFDTSEN